ncbi:GPI ethanolamine phosphate transferase 3 isoform X1 [Neodiprion lecontei]|uniref:GPI ethanolamine phosphate transferase 3 n=1 Tax=Neodiprion lecontei TaxID=441921 RepID=A0A6J0CCM4_NEOLC|nr:GPI ethanolamine phosphate transferase 3 isoform X1 [Neodiprion lecontei]XP_046597746.1 GPI ethanolamine phosphate transferase 3 isoform X1 [Neodiprion lecontei]
MRKQWSYFAFLGWLAYLMIAGLILFTRGFLLTRISRLEVGQCDIRLKPCGFEPGDKCSGGIDYKELFSDQETAAKTCLGTQARVVLLMVDALQYEFLVWNDNLTPENTSYHQNKVPVVKDALKKYPDTTRFYKFIADPPTTTMQRLKGLTTGSLPTFIDAGSNFATEEINEDNIIDQASSQGIVFMGDDTWMGLYPGRFMRHFPYPSFNVWDLDTVDDGVRQQIFIELKKTDWSLLVAHTLGVDHCGHRYGPNHPEMSRKLTETNDLIEKVIATLQDDMMLIVVGDHGMTSTGDHGGDSKSEVEAAMFVYSKIPLLGKKFAKNIDEVHQIDLVPTLSSILGIPIPFSNLGTTILDVLPRNFHKNTNLNDFQYALHSLWSNIVQTKNYIDTYSSESSLFPRDKLEIISQRYQAIHGRIKHVENFEEFQSFVNDAKSYLATIRDMCVEIWVQFDSSLMSKGLVITFSTIFFSYMIVEGIPRYRMHDIFESSFLYTSALVNVATSVLVGALYFFKIIEDVENITLFATSIVSAFMFAVLVVQNWLIICMNWYKKCKSRKWLNFTSKLILLLSICGLFSNSYIIEEALVLSFLLTTLIWLLILNIKSSKNEISEKKSKSGLRTYSSTVWIVLVLLGLIATCFVRFSHYFWSCREEQHRSCTFNELRKPGASVLQSTGRIFVIVTLVIIALFISLARIWLHSCGNLVGFSPNVTAARYFPGIIVVCMGGYWVLQHLPKDAKVKFVRPWQVNMLTWVVYFCITIGIFCVYLFPLYVYLLPKKKESLNVYGKENIIPQLFNGMKGLICRKKEHEVESVPVVYGLGTTYSATFITLSVFLTLLCALLLGDTLAPSIVIMYIVCICVLGITAIERYQHATNINELFEVPTPSLLCWFLISEYFFYATGHQPTFPKIHWNAAFVGTSGIFQTNVLPAVLIGINTFGSHILLGVMLPLIVMAPFTIYFIFPNIAGSKAQSQKDLRRGELLLYESDSSLLTTVFSVSAKYVLFHGIRMFGCMLAATMHCRHLMVWNVFSPKLIFQGLSFLVTTGSVMLSFLLLIRLHDQVDKLCRRISKSR